MTFHITYRNASDNRVDTVIHRGTQETATETLHIVADHEAAPGTPVRLFRVRGSAEFHIETIRAPKR